MRAVLFVLVMLLLFGGCARDQLRGSYGCPEYQLVCGGVCTDVATDPAHCGACDTACSAAEECSASRCRPACEASRTPCADGCVDTESDVDNCGACGNECAPGARCVRGECSATGCPPGQVRCGDACVDVSSNANHCGECFAACDDGMGCDDYRCVDGCGSDTNCSGSCVDTTTDRDHCGGCEIRCTPGANCNSGECQCGGDAGALCEEGCVDLASDPDNCGSCGASCDGGCILGLCCPFPNAVCERECVDLATSAKHCGACFTACADGRACSNGACSMECDAGFVPCGTDCVNLEADPKHCGSCGAQCAEGETCMAGGCGGECQPPAIACGNACVDPESDPNNCGGCDLVCAEGWLCRAGACRDASLGCDFGKLEFPVVLNGGNSVGDLTTDGACNLYVALDASNLGFGGVVYSVSSATGMASAIIDELPNLVRGLVYRPEDGLLYGAYPDRLIRLQPDGTGLEVLDESFTGQYLNGMALAPSSWGRRDGHLVVAKDNGEIVSYDPEDPVPEVFAVTEPNISDVVFDGPQLYVAAYSLMQIQRVTPGGVVSDFVDLPCAPDGLAVEPGERLFAACGDTGEVYAIDIDTRDFELVAKLSLSGSWAPTALLWDNYTLFAVEETTGLNALFP